jgi:hypothetical protein
MAPENKDVTRVPVTSETLDGYKGGLKRPEVTTGAPDPVKARIAKVAEGAGGFGGSRSRGAGMLVDTAQIATPYTSGYWLDSYRNSYAYGLSDRSGTYDIPTYFAQMNEQNGGLLYWPVTLREKYSWYRYWARTDAYIGRSLELLSDLPMSKLSLNMPSEHGKLTKKKREEILRFFNYQMEVLDAFKLCQDALWELNMIGNVYIFHEWDDKKKMWSRAVMLPPEEVFVFQFPFSENRRVEYKPQRLIELIKTGEYGPPGSSSQTPGTEGDCSRGNMDKEIVENIPLELVEMVREHGCIVMDSDPMTGSFTHQLSRRRSPYEDLGASVLERVLVPMLQKEHYRYTQLSLASRNMTPKNMVTAPGLMPEEVDTLRTQIDLSYLDPEYTIVTNYEVSWEQIGADNRLLDLSSEYERIENQVFAGLGVTRELLTGEGSFAGNKVTVEILNTMFLLTREVLKSYIEKKLFIPICEAHGWFEEDENGVKEYWHPKIGFNRLTIRDNAEVFDSLFQLYQKGSLPIDVIYELFNLNADDMHDKLKEQLFTVKDANFNRTVEEISGEVGRSLVENTDISEKIAKYLDLEYKAPPEEGGEEGEDGFAGEFGGFGQGTGEEGEAAVPEAALSDEDADILADEIANQVPDGASDEDILTIVDDITKEKEETPAKETPAEPTKGEKNEP